MPDPNARPQLELPHEKHNRVGREIVDLIYNEYPNGPIETRILVLESIVYAFLGGMTKNHAAQLRILRLLVDGVMERLEERAKS